MLPIVLAPRRLQIVLFGSGPRIARRMTLLREAGVEQWTHVAAPDREDATDLARFDLVYVADVDRDIAERIAGRARTAGTPVNVEDVADLCDFHTPAVVRRGALTMTVSTGGLAPGLAGILAERIGELFGPVWATRLGLIEAKRRALRTLGASHGDIRAALAAELARRRWLPNATRDAGPQPVDKAI